MKLIDILETFRTEAASWVANKIEGKIVFTVITTAQGGITRLEIDKKQVLRDRR